MFNNKLGYFPWLKGPDLSNFQVLYVYCLHLINVIQTETRASADVSNHLFANDVSSKPMFTNYYPCKKDVSTFLKTQITDSFLLISNQVYLIQW